MVTKEKRQNVTSSFEADVAEVLTRLRTRLAEIIAAVPDPITKGTDLKRALNIDRQLSWRVFKIASTPHLVSAGPYVPSPASMSVFLRAARKRGVPENLIESASQVAADFEEVVEEHAGDRATFESMISSLAGDESAEYIHLANRRLAFRGQRHTLGTQTKTQFKLLVIQPSEEDSTLLDAIHVEGFIGLRRLRYDAPLVVSCSGHITDVGLPHAVRRRPLEPESNCGGMSLLAEFCSKPLPKLRAGMGEKGLLTGELSGQDVGNHAAVTCVEGHILPGIAGRFSQEDNRMCASVVTVRTPCEVLILDWLVRKDTFGPIEPVALVRTDHLAEPSWDELTQKRLRLPGKYSVDFLGRSPSVLHTPDVPRYAELGKYVFERAGWKADEFEVYRCRVEYPAVPSSVAMRASLPEAPAK